MTGVVITAVIVITGVIVKTRVVVLTGDVVPDVGLSSSTTARSVVPYKNPQGPGRLDFFGPRNQKR